MRGEQGGIGYFVAVQMQDRQHGAVIGGVQEFVGMPRGRQRPGFRFAITDHTGDDEAGIIEDRAERMAERLAEFAAFVNRAGTFGRRVAGDASGK